MFTLIMRIDGHRVWKKGPLRMVRLLTNSHKNRRHKMENNRMTTTTCLHCVLLCNWDFVDL